MPINIAHTVKIAGISAAVSNQWTATDSYRDLLGEKVVKSFKKSSGVEGRYLAAPRQTAGDLCFAAARGLLEADNIDPADIGALILMTQSPDYGEPATACVLQHRLGLSRDCLAFDVTLGCSAYPYGLAIAAGLMETSAMKYALLLAGDTKGATVEPASGQEEREGGNSISLLLGDVGTATLLQKTAPDKTRPLVSICKTDGDGFRAAGNPWRGYRYPDSPKGTAFMTDLDVFDYIITRGPEMINEFLACRQTAIDDYDCLALHQASRFTLQQVARRIGCPMDKIPLSLEKYGNTGPASVPLTIVHAYGDRREDKEINVLMCGFGVGLSIGIASAMINIKSVLPVIHTDEWFDDGMADRFVKP